MGNNLTVGSHTECILSATRQCNSTLLYNDLPIGDMSTPSPVGH